MGRKRVTNPGGRPSLHGARALQKRLNANNLDGRQRVAKMLKAIRDDLSADAGGWEHLTARERLLVERAAALTVMVESLESYAFSQPSLLQGDGKILAVLESYISFVNTQRLTLVAMGLKPQRPDSETDLHDYLQQKSPQKATE